MMGLIKEMANKNIGSLCLFLNNPKNKDYLEEINNNIPIESMYLPTSEKIYYYINEIKNIILCSCGKKKTFIGFKNGYRKTCGDKKCFVNKRKETNLEKYGVDNPKKSKEILKKEKENIKHKWGVDHYMLSDKVKNKFKKTMKEKWGVEWAQQSEEIKEKSLETWNNNEKKEEIISKRVEKLVNKTDNQKIEINNKKRNTIIEKYGTYDNFINYRLDIIRNKSLEKWGVDHHFKSEEIKNKRIKSYKRNKIEKIKSNLPENLLFNQSRGNNNNTDSILNFTCSDCNLDFDINRQLFYFRKQSKVPICLNCNPILSGKSNRELEVLELIRNNYDGNILSNNKNVIKGEIDIYLPDLKLGFEFNGLYWHSNLYKNKLFHLNKTNQCNDSNISLLHIWEDDWDYKKNIVKSIILNKLGKSEKIFARKCKVKEVNNNKLIRKFLEENHIQGFIGSKIKLGLFYNDELVSLMTFGNLRRSLGQKSMDKKFELLRFCNKINTTVVGGASKLFSFFIKNYEFNEIISYSDKSRGNGNMYKKLGFKLISETEPNYYWVINGVRKHRFNFRKDKLIKNGYDSNKTEIEIMHEEGYYRIFDCGNKKWKFN